MPINQAELQTLISLSKPINMDGRKTWVMDGGNFQTACWWFKKITGVEFNLLSASVRTSKDGGFRFLTVQDGDVSITLRGGSSTTLDGAWVAPENTAPRSKAYDQPAMRYQDPANTALGKVPVLVQNRPVKWSEILTGQPNPHTSVPTIEIHNAEELEHVGSFLPFRGKANKKVIVEIKFTTRAKQTTVTIK